ncbi:MAG TPA: hypothetical protein VHQ47_19650 [Phycisphaerae bacterium]|nr:hypothetical protein [Phycisphaerae bacterium]
MSDSRDNAETAQEPELLFFSRRFMEEIDQILSNAVVLALHWRDAASPRFDREAILAADGITDGPVVEKKFWKSSTI